MKVLNSIARIICVVLVSYFAESFAQITPQQEYLSNILYEIDNGRISQAIAKLDSCEYLNFSKTEKLEFHRLKTMAYLFDGNNTGAKTESIELLKLKPNYREFANTDPFEFTSFLSKFTVSDKIITSFKIAVQNCNRYDISKNYNIQIDREHYKFNPENSFEAQLGFGYTFNKWIQLNALYTIGNIGFNESFTHVSGMEKTIGFNALFNGFEINNKTVITSSTLSSHVNIGIGSQFLSGTYSQFQLNTESGSEYSSFENLDYLNKNQMYVSVGAGITLPVNSDKISIELTLRNGLVDLFNDDKSLSDLNANIEYQYIPDIFKLRQTIISVGYVKTLKYQVN